MCPREDLFPTPLSLYAQGGGQLVFMEAKVKAKYFNETFTLPCKIFYPIFSRIDQMGGTLITL